VLFYSPPAILLCVRGEEYRRSWWSGGLPKAVEDLIDDPEPVVDTSHKVWG